MSHLITQPTTPVGEKEPLIKVSVKEDGKTVVHYFKTQKQANAFLKRHKSIQAALDAAGSWKHLDSEDGPDPLDELDRIRHESKPTPLFKL